MGFRHIHFIINPVAGNGKSPLTKEYLEQYFINTFHNLHVKYSTHKKHAIELTKKSIAEGADIIVACGGDGTVNEVASSLVGTSIPLGIIPIGSGNGLASNLSIPKNLRRALELIKNRHTVRIDVGRFNDKYFFSNTGIGFDASVIKNYESSERRTLTGYLMACLRTFRQSKASKEIQICINDLNILTDPFMIFASNSNEMGYKLSLTPKASLQDGLLDVLVISKIGRFKMLLLGVLMVLNKSHLMKEVKSFQTKSLVLTNQGGTTLNSQIDGELHKVPNGRISIQIEEHELEVIVPENLI
ncbi:MULTISPECIES: diacylglycerol kinase family protein [unclassified Arenibacter]|uniref:diacylglycerol/lipid kinase family protein n=1 Tax=unclassified Arenibacter TaxID=2615047 RepID=UPI000E345533|nr:MULTISPECIES: diacylglycerol kinase family protein [unclassified Arenibacter]MCM4164830.1 diacylglycerol kinase [Arenibacter sp. A80]RFT55246.1 diacylglycerol kinase family lipid kinase [Arenibacter sp. P308M17]